MQAKGLVKRVSAAGDRRSVVITLTARGARMADEVARALDHLRDKVESSPTIAERDVARLRNVAEQASRMAAESGE